MYSTHYIKCIYNTKLTEKVIIMNFRYEYERPAVTVDCVVFGLDDEDLKILLIQRDLDPFMGKWALPGGFLHINESPEQAARRELAEETGVKIAFLEQLYTYGDSNRDPREHTITIAHFALVKMSGHKIQAASDARNAAWFSIDDTPKLAFDHAIILKTAHERLRAKVKYQPIGFELLPDKFALRHLQYMYESILDRKIDKRNFRKKMLGMDILIELDEIEKDVSHRAAKLYRFDKKK